MLNWFEQRDIDHAPDESTIKRKIKVVWRELNRAFERIIADTEKWS